MRKQVASIYKDQYDKVLAQATVLTEGISPHQIIEPSSDTTSAFQKDRYNALFDHWKENIDFKYGGFGHTPKFPMPAGWEFLLQYNYLTGNPKALEVVTTTLDAMAKGGIYDQVGRGFARYSVDKYWKLPHCACAMGGGSHSAIKKENVFHYVTSSDKLKIEHEIESYIKNIE